MKKFLLSALLYAIFYFLLSVSYDVWAEGRHFNEIWLKAAVSAIAYGLLFELVFRLVLKPLAGKAKKKAS